MVIFEILVLFSIFLILNPLLFYGLYVLRIFYKSILLMQPTFLCSAFTYT